MDGARDFGEGPIESECSSSIRNGYVTAFMQLGKSDDLIQPVEWHDYVSIQEDGGFQFASMPREGKLQLMRNAKAGSRPKWSRGRWYKAVSSTPTVRRWSWSWT